MTYQSICISSGHSTKCQGAIGLLNEVNEATRVSDRLVEELKRRGVNVPPAFHDTVSTTQDSNLNRIVDWHNDANPPHQLDISVHFNASNGQGHGCEVWWQTQRELASKLSAAIATAGFTDRGEKPSEGSLFFLNHTAAPAVLLEICFVDNAGDAQLYQRQNTFDTLCSAMANVLGGPLQAGRPPIDRPERPPAPADTLFYAKGTCSWFGGPEDTTGVSATEGLAFIFSVQDAPHLFLPDGTPGTENKGLARKLNSKAVNYLACRWDYSVTPKPSLLEHMALVTSVRTGRATLAYPADWGPHEEQTGRAADLSQSLMRDLDLETDDEVIVQYPAPEAGA